MSPGDNDRAVSPAAAAAAAPVVVVLIRNVALCAAVCDVLKQTFTGCLFVPVHDPEDARRAAKEHKPLAVLAEMVRGDARSAPLFSGLRPAGSDALLVALSDYEDDWHRSVALASGADLFVSKRRMLKTVIPEIAGLLQRGQAHAQ